MTRSGLLILMAFAYGGALFFVLTGLPGWYGYITIIGLATSWALFQRAFPGGLRNASGMSFPESATGFQRFDELDAARRDLELASTSAWGFDVTLRPLLRRLVAERLVARYGTRINLDSEQARRLLSPVLWESTRPLERPRDVRSAGIPLPELAQLVQDLESL